NQPPKPTKELSGRRSTATLTEQDLYDHLSAEEKELKALELEVYKKISKNKELTSKFYKIRTLVELKEFIKENNL
ncbi:MAG: hypothetical protein ACRC6U_09360, partial [Fusobacteriaceae bacterium]